MEPSQKAVEVAGLAKTFGRGKRLVRALDDFNLIVPSGIVFGLVGPNGAGKTTALRALLGLIKAQGSIKVLDREIPKQLPEVISKVGSLIERPNFFPSFSGYKNLKLLCDIEGLNRSTIAASLDQVGLYNAAQRSFGGYSTGMKQRLGLAAALLKSPELLILDEPATGLDPAGIVEIRTLIRNLADRGTTILLSSHRLDDVQDICERIAILSNGRTLASGTLTELLDGRTEAGTFVGVSNVKAAASALDSAGVSFKTMSKGIRVGPSTPPAEIASILTGAGVAVNELTPIRQSLEQVFLEITAKGEPQ